MTEASALDFLNGQNVFVFDTETTGLPKGSPSGWGSYWDYRMNEKYDNSRIVSIAWSFINNYSKNHINLRNMNDLNDLNDLNDCKPITHYIRYPEGFTEIPTTHIHGISLQDALMNGSPFGYILDYGGLGNALLDSNYIVAHNVLFDYHILMNELWRLVDIKYDAISISLNTREMANKCIEHLKNLKDNCKVICTGIISTPICKMGFPSAKTYLGKKQNYKMPKLCELYRYYYNKDFENAHSADGDVRALLDVMKKM